MNKLEVGLYVRTKDGYIVNIMRHEHYWINKEEWNYITTDIGLNFEIDAILKASHNIIDLIEVGDYVNGERVCAVEKYEEGKLTVLALFEDYCTQQNIKSIVTKEMYSSVEYRVEVD